MTSQILIAGLSEQRHSPGKRPHKRRAFNDIIMRCNGFLMIRLRIITVISVIIVMRVFLFISFFIEVLLLSLLQ